MDKNKSAAETLTWTAPSHIQHKRSSSWYLFFILITFGLIAFAVYTRSIMTGITFGLLSLVILIISTQKPREITYKITRTGIAVGSNIYPHKIIKKFWIVYNPPEVTTLNIETSAYMNNRVTMQIGKQDPIEIKHVLGKYIHEDIDKEESLSETLARKLKI